MNWRGAPGFLLASLPIAFGVVYGWVGQPGYTDAFYYINAANRLVGGDGLTDPYLWTFIGAPDALPVPSHLYWMPLPSLLGAAGMRLLGAPGAYWAAQMPYLLLVLLLGYTGYWLGHRLTGTIRGAWAVGLMLLLGGFYGRFWGMIATFTPFAVLGAGCLIALGRGAQQRRWPWFALAGALAAAAHLTRADGLLLLLAGFAALGLLWLRSQIAFRQAARFALVLAVAYAVTMSPWLWRNWQAVGDPLPTGGAQGIWYTEYNDIFSYPPDATPQRFFAEGGWSLLLRSRWDGLASGLTTLIVVQGVVFLAPLMLLALARRWQQPFLTPFWIYALGLHLAMTLVFPFPGSRGGLFHSSAALFPFWLALGVTGIGDAVDWLAKRRPWNPRRAKAVFTWGAVLVVAALSLSISGGRTERSTPPRYIALDAALPPDARVMVNDPAQLYYYTGRGGVTLPNEPPEAILTLANQYQIDYLLLELGQIDGQASLAAPLPLLSLPADPPSFLAPLPLDVPNMRLYAIDRAE